MKFQFLFPAAVLGLPSLATAQSVQSFGTDFIDFINGILIPIVFSVALVIFIYQMVRYFIIDVNDADGRENARNYAIFSLIAFVLMVSVWGIVNLVVAGTGLGRSEVVCPDTVPEEYCGEGSETGDTGENPWEGVAP